jgi:HEAT repeat protein
VHVNDLSNDALLARALIEEQEDAQGVSTDWEAINELRRRATHEVFTLAEGLTRSSMPVERKLGLDVLGQLGLDRPFREETVDLLRRLLATEQHASVIAAALVAFGHLNDTRGRAYLLTHCAHPALEVRRAVAWALPNCACMDDNHKIRDAQVVAALIGLMVDEDDGVRDWATFGLGRQIEADTPDIREALADRMLDSHDEARAEAIAGLLLRHDDRAIEPALELLRSGTVPSGVLIALKEVGDDRLAEELSFYDDGDDV